jgi:hypothetical protein
MHQEDLCGLRFFNEIKLIFSEENPLSALRRSRPLAFPPALADLRPNLKIDRRCPHHDAGGKAIPGSGFCIYGKMGRCEF